MRTIDAKALTHFMRRPFQAIDAFPTVADANIEVLADVLGLQLVGRSMMLADGAFRGVDAYNYGRRLKAIRGLTPYEAVCQSWTKQPERFKVDSSNYTPGRNI